MSALFKRIDTVFLKVDDFEKAIEWYCTVLGFTLRWKEEGYAALNIGETPLTLMRKNKEEELPANSRISFNFFAPEIEKAHQYLLQNNVKVGPIKQDGMVMWFEFEDLEGNHLEVCHFNE